MLIIHHKWFRGTQKYISACLYPYLDQMWLAVDNKELLLGIIIWLCVSIFKNLFLFLFQEKLLLVLVAMHI